MNLNTPPIFSSPIATSMIPAIMLAIIRPCIPYCETIPATITMKAPVGPPMRKFEPPKKLMRNPATIAVMSPCCGLTPEAIPNAMARGRAMIPTMMPAMRSDTKSCLLYLPFLNSPKNLGLKTSLKLYFTVNTTFWAQNQRHQNEKNTGRL